MLPRKAASFPAALITMMRRVLLTTDVAVLIFREPEAGSFVHDMF
jgi:hypothetical protein